MRQRPGRRPTRAAPPSPAARQQQGKESTLPPSEQFQRHHRVHAPNGCDAARRQRNGEELEIAEPRLWRARVRSPEHAWDRVRFPLDPIPGSSRTNTIVRPRALPAPHALVTARRRRSARARRARGRARRRPGPTGWGRGRRCPAGRRAAADSIGERTEHRIVRALQQHRAILAEAEGPRARAPRREDVGGAEARPSVVLTACGAARLRRMRAAARARRRASAAGPRRPRRSRPPPRAAR